MTKTKVKCGDDFTDLSVVWITPFLNYTIVFDDQEKKFCAIYILTATNTI